MIFGRLVIRPTDLARIIATKVIEQAGRIESRNKRRLTPGEKAPKRRAIRTKAVKVVLRRAGKKLGFVTFPDNDKRLSRARGQSLYDLIWWDDRSGRKGVALAVESEWNANEGDIIHDFEKLLFIKSPLKLMIYRVRGKNKDKIRDSIKEYLLHFRQHVHGENYILCEFQPDWSCACYLFRAKRVINGRITDLKFRALLNSEYLN